jgi:hypothetical protein
MPCKDKYRIYAELLQLQHHIEAAATREENCKAEEHNDLPGDLLGGRSSLS